MTTTDEKVMNHFPTAAALICAVHDRDAEAVHTLLGALDPDSMRSVIVLLADMVPDDKTPTQLLPERGPEAIPRDTHGVPLRREDWTTQELRAAHAAHTRRELTPWSITGEREYHRRAKARRDALARANREALKARTEASAA